MGGLEVIEPIFFVHPLAEGHIENIWIGFKLMHTRVHMWISKKSNAISNAHEDFSEHVFADFPIFIPPDSPFVVCVCEIYQFI